jgi:hypothetical protein
MPGDGGGGGGIKKNKKNVGVGTHTPMHTY